MGEVNIVVMSTDCRSVEAQAAGNVSWALMKHPEGLPCDLFITHTWAEGIYEFVDKVEHSWPPGATGAYVCFLSNPQNLDISDLIQSPSESPFARVLENASSLLVVPNRVCSNYEGLKRLLVEVVPPRRTRASVPRPIGALVACDGAALIAAAVRAACLAKAPLPPSSRWLRLWRLSSRGQLRQLRLLL